MSPSVSAETSIPRLSSQPVQVGCGNGHHWRMGSSTRRPRSALESRSIRETFWTARARCRVMLLPNPCIFWSLQTTLSPALLTETQRLAKASFSLAANAGFLSYYANWILPCVSSVHHAAYILSRWLSELPPDSLESKSAFVFSNDSSALSASCSIST